MTFETRRYPIFDSDYFREITFETEVRPDNLEEIRRHRSEGYSLTSSVAKLIVGESRTLLIRYMLEEQEEPQLEADFLTDIGTKSIREAYRQASEALLDAESITRIGEPVADARTAIQYYIMALLSERRDAIFPIPSKIDPFPAMKYSEMLMARELHLRSMVPILVKEGPLQFIDSWTNSEIIEPVEWWELQATINDVLSIARQRFHKLYIRVQEENL